MAARDPGRVTAILYSRLATSLRSLAIILPIHQHTITHIHVCNRIALITIRIPMRPNAGIRVLTLLSLVQYTDTFRSRDYEQTSYYPFFRHATRWSQQLRILPSQRDIEAWLLRSTMLWPFHDSIEPPDNSGGELREQWCTRRVTGNEDDDYHQRVQVDIKYFQWLQLTTGHQRTRDCTPDRVHSQPKSKELRDQVAHKARRRQ